MVDISVGTAEGYSVIIGRGLISEIGLHLKTLFPKSKALVVSDDIVYGIYGQKVKKNLQDEGFEVYDFTFPHGEASKNLLVCGEILEVLASHSFAKQDILMAVGGGVTGDITGLAASLYLRGSRFIQVPTTLLAFIDSSIGGKNAANLKSGKNLVGTIYQPSAVLIDADVADTLSDKIFFDGMAEAVKYAMISGEEMFSLLEHESVRDGVEDLVVRCINLKKDIVLQDVSDKNERKVLNLGHTFGHAIEFASGYSISHGNAVSVGMVMITRAAVKKGLCAAEVLDRLIALLRKFSLQISVDFDKSLIKNAVMRDKKISKLAIDMSIPHGIGDCRVEKVELSDIDSWIDGGFGG